MLPHECPIEGKFIECEYHSSVAKDLPSLECYSSGSY